MSEEGEIAMDAVEIEKFVNTQADLELTVIFLPQSPKSGIISMHLHTQLYHM